MQRVIDLAEQTHQLKLKKIGLLSLPANSVAARNKELLSLGVGAVSGALSLSIHPGFALIFLYSYRMYKSANKPTSDRLQSPQKVRLLNDQLAEIAAEIQINRDILTDTESPESVPTQDETIPEKKSVKTMSG